nr:hypothetical protein Q903MT_gene5885 [Picea sitchensis]
MVKPNRFIQLRIINLCLAIDCYKFLRNTCFVMNARERRWVGVSQLASAGKRSSVDKPGIGSRRLFIRF